MLDGVSGNIYIIFPLLCNFNTIKYITTLEDSCILGLLII